MRYFFSFFLMISLNGFSQKSIIYADHTYEPNIKTVLIYPSSGESNLARGMQVPVVELGDNLKIEFDDLNAKYEQFHVKIIHCDINWKPSKLNDIEFVKDFNDEIINDYSVSQSTKIPYYHYSSLLPNVKISGNYLAIVWRDRNKSDLIITRRFIVVDNKIGISAIVKQAVDPEFRKTKQQIDFELNFRNLPLRAPKEDLKVVIKKNFRWNQTLLNLKPSNVFEGQRTIEYNFFSNENLIDGGNEYRFFDARSTFRKGFGIEKVELGDVDDIWISTQDNHSKYTYIDAIDQNGLFSPQNLESRNTTVEADYPFFTFTLREKEIKNKKVYVNGSFNNWELNEANLMEFDNEYGGYVATMQLKQGIYNYDFVTIDSEGIVNETELEGNFSETENIYEIIVYTRPQAGRSDQIVGYKLIQCNQKK